jgi:hypothetical protein
LVGNLGFGCALRSHFPWGLQHNKLYNCTTTWHQPGLSRGFVDRFKELATDRKQTDRQTAVFIELLPQLKTGVRVGSGGVNCKLSVTI